MALTLSKTGITTGATIQVGHVTQSIDAFTKAVAYDISLSGSLTLTGSLNSFNGFTGSFTGSHFGTANLTGSFTGSLRGDITGQAQTLSTSFYPNAVGPAVQSAKIIAGTARLNGGSPATITFPVTELAAKTLGVDCFVTATLSGSSPYTGTVNVGSLTGGQLSFTGNNGNADLFFFQVVYY
jgi:hypothetical protein